MRAAVRLRHGHPARAHGPTYIRDTPGYMKPYGVRQHRCADKSRPPLTCLTSETVLHTLQPAGVR